MIGKDVPKDFKSLKSGMTRDVDLESRGDYTQPKVSGGRDRLPINANRGTSARHK